MSCRYGGYTGKILRVDLDHSRFETLSTDRYLPLGIGGRGVAAIIAWNEISRDMTPFDSRTPLIILTGPLTGTLAPFSGRTTVCGLAPQGYPREWYTRSSFGGHWGPELKYSGFDGLIIVGKSPFPVFLKIDRGRPEIVDARKLWGKGLIEAQREMLAGLEKGYRIFAIGPAGENLVRIAIAATETESASGQGGFGAVMGSKNLKAIAVKGDFELTIAQPDRFQKICKLVRDEAHGSHGWPHTPKLDPEKVARYGQRFQACTQACSVRCYDARFYSRVPSKLCPGKKLSGQIDCIAGLFPGLKDTFYNWSTGFEAGFEVSQIANDIGVNHWELLVGTFPWLRYLVQDGIRTEIDGRKIDLDDPHFWSETLRSIGHRTGEFGYWLGEGLPRAVDRLGIGMERLSELYPAWGYAGHWDGHGDHINKIFFPFWIVAAVQWAVDTRDPISSAHGYVQNVMGWCKQHSPEFGIDWEIICNISEKIYGSRRSADPLSGYDDKAFPAYWHGHRSVMKDSLPVDDQIFPRIFSRFTEDHLARAGGFEGTEFELEMLNAATGFEWNQNQFEHYCARTIHLERQLLIRNFDRSRRDDESLISYFEKPENRVNPYIGQPQSLDALQFRKVLDEYYELRGWDREWGRPTPETIQKFDLPEV